MLGFGFFSQFEETFYTDVLESEIGTIFKGSLIEFSYFLSPDTKHYERSVYTVLDFLGDIGGLFDALRLIAEIFIYAVSFLTNDGPHNYILKRLFKRNNSTREHH